MSVSTTSAPASSIEACTPSITSGRLSTSASWHLPGRPAVVLAGQLELLERRAHAAVVDDDAAARSPAGNRASPDATSGPSRPAPTRLAEPVAAQLYTRARPALRALPVRAALSAVCGRHAVSHSLGRRSTNRPSGRETRPASVPFCTATADRQRPLARRGPRPCRQHTPHADQTPESATQATRRRATRRRARQTAPSSAGHTVVAVVGLGYVGPAHRDRAARRRLPDRRDRRQRPAPERDPHAARPSCWSPSSATCAATWRATGSCSPTASRRSTPPTWC